LECLQEKEASKTKRQGDILHTKITHKYLFYVLLRLVVLMLLLLVLVLMLQHVPRPRVWRVIDLDPHVGAISVLVKVALGSVAVVLARCGVCVHVFVLLHE
jgi:hypothetical protein